MNGKQVMVVRVYAMEGHEHLEEVLRIVHDQEQIANVHVFRAIAGTGGERDVHTSSLLSLSLRLPVSVEFFAEPAKVQRALEQLKQLGFKDILVWSATYLQFTDEAEPSPDG